MRRASKVDDNQPAIVHAMRRLGATVEPCHTVGGGFPDLCIGYAGKTYLVEIKDGSKPPSARRLNPAQRDWHDRWRGHVKVIETTEQAIEWLRELR